MASDSRPYFGEFNEFELMNFMREGDQGAYFEILFRYYKPLSTAISDMLLDKITEKEPVSEYIDCVILAEYCADKIAHSTMVLLWNNREWISDPSIYTVILDMLKLQLQYDNEDSFISYTESLEIKVLTYLLLQPRQIKRNAELRDRLKKWQLSEPGIHNKLFIFRFIEGLKLTQLSASLQLPIPVIEGHLQTIYNRFEAYLKKPENRII